MANSYLSQTLSTKLAQQLRITPQLQQAIKLLQLSRLELEASIQKELNENPVLEEIQDTMEEELEGQSQKNDENQTSLESSSPSDQETKKEEDFNWENYLESSYNKAAGTQTKDFSEEFNNYDNIVSSPQSLQGHLVWQISLSGFNEEETNWLLLLINYVEDDGYIKTDLNEIAKNEKVEKKSLEEMLPFLHEMDPPGVGARNLKECLLIQAQHLEEDTNDLVLLIQEHLHHLERRDFLSISKAKKWSVKYIQDLHQVIFLEMDPKPGLSYSPKQDVEYITPDVYVYKKSNEYVISLNDEGFPRLRISPSYRHLLQSHLKSENKQTRDYIQEKLKSALWLIKSIQQRQKTIYKVAESIVKHQIEFLDKGPAHIKPMILRDVAQDIEMHESTVSRVTTAKYIHTPQGIFELKYFFNSGIQKIGWRDLSQ